MRRMLTVMLAMWAAWGSTALEAADKPSVKVGDRWVYRFQDVRTGLPNDLTTIEVIAVEGDTIRTRATRSGQDREDEYDSQWNPRFTDGRRFTPHRHWFAFPLKVGQSWQGPSSYPNTTGTAEINSTVKGSVVAEEKITVPAGTFDTMKLIVVGSYTSNRSTPGYGGGGGTIKWTIWYAPAVKRHVRWEFEEGRAQGRSELMEYAVK